MTNEEMLLKSSTEAARLLIEADLPERPTTAMMILHTQRAVNAGISVGIQCAEEMLQRREVRA